MRSIKPRVLVDIDGLVLNFIDRALRVARELFEIELEHDDVDDYRMDQVLITKGGARFDEPAWFAAIRERGYCLSIPEYPGVRESLTELRKIADLYAVTVPFPGMPYWMFEREEKLTRDLGFQTHQIIHTAAKYVCVGDVLLEDTTRHLVNWRAHHPDGVAIRMRRPYNAREPFEQGITVNNWTELVREVQTALDLRERKRRAVYDD